MGHILYHNRLPFGFRLDRSEYWDFFLSQPSYGSDSTGVGLSDRCLITYIDTTDTDCVQFDRLYSKSEYFWDEAVNNGVLLKNIGYTGVDNGLISYQKDRISNEQFLKLYKHSEYSIEKGDLRLLLNKVNGNNQIFTYDNDFIEEDGMLVSKLNGGFFQGFFKTDDNYCVLPKNIANGTTFEVVLKKHDFEKDGKYTMNDMYKENKGLFLYIGTRAENKWWKGLKTEFDPTKSINGFVIDGYVNSEYTDTSNINANYIKPSGNYFFVDEYLADGYQTDECEDKCCCNKTTSQGKPIPPSTSTMPKFTYPEALNVYEDNAVWFDQNGHLWVENELLTTGKVTGGHISPSSRHKCGSCYKYFADGYIKSDYYDNYCTCDIYAREDYIKPEVYIDEDEDLVMSDGYSIKQPNIKEYRSDNKFLMFDRTCDGYTTENWVEGSEVIITDVLTPKIENYFLLFNRTCNGYTTETIDKLLYEQSRTYNILGDLYNNALGFQIDDNGRIGYKYLVKDCDTEEGYRIENEWSGENAVREDKWSTVTVKIIPLSNHYRECSETSNPTDKMKLMIYVNGKLKLVSKDIPSLTLRKLNDAYSKQEGVPYNISLGGGSQGLCDVIYLNYRKLPEYSLPIEKAFAGTFIGYIKSLRIHNCGISYSGIVQNAIFDGCF